MKWSIWEHLIWTLKQEGFTKESLCRSLTVIWVLGSNTKLTVNSLAYKKEKSQAAHGPQLHMVSGRQVPRMLNDPQMICYDR